MIILHFGGFSSGLLHKYKLLFVLQHHLKPSKYAKYFVNSPADSRFSLQSAHW